MQSENVELVMSLYRCWGAENESSAPLELLAEDFEYVNPPYAVHPGTRHGKQGWLAADANLSDSFESWVHEPGEVSEHGDKVLVITTFRARGRGSSVDLEKYEPHVWTVRDGKVLRFEWFNDRDEAMRAVGAA